MSDRREKDYRFGDISDLAAGAVIAGIDKAEELAHNYPKTARVLAVLAEGVCVSVTAKFLSRRIQSILKTQASNNTVTPPAQRIA